MTNVNGKLAVLLGARYQRLTARAAARAIPAAVGPGDRTGAAEAGQTAAASA